MPDDFSWKFGVCAGVLLLCAGVRQGLRRNEAPRDRKALYEHIIDVILALPATSLAVWGNLSAWFWLNHRELRQATRLLEWILEERRLPLSSTPVVIPNDARREKIVLGLMLTGILDLRNDEGRPYLRLAHTVEPELLLPGATTMNAQHL
jgi:hypothetical protein